MSATIEILGSLVLVVIAALLLQKWTQRIERKRRQCEAYWPGGGAQ